MDFLMNHLPVAASVLWVFVLGTVVGSFLNVFAARLPFEKSVVWPGSRCFTCLRPVRLTDNLPLIGYLRLRGRCRSCGAPYSARYLWVELGTGVAFAALFYWEIVRNGLNIPGFDRTGWSFSTGMPSPVGWAVFAYHATLVTLLIAASVIDAGHKFIPPVITYPGAAVGLVGAALMPWPWPGPVPPENSLLYQRFWSMVETWGQIPAGVQPWPAWGWLGPGPQPAWAPLAVAPPGTWKLGLLNGLAGAAVGMLVVRAIRFLFQFGFKREALGAGDGDLLMMAGAFVGWQPVALAVFVGALIGLVVNVPLMALARRKPADPGGGPPADPREMPFGPALAAGVVVCWYGWRWLGPRVQFALFDEFILSLVAVVVGGGMLAAGMILRRPDEPAPAAE